MFRQSPRRNQRNKGFKVKHALQICLLLAISIWLVYQVQHSRNQKAAIVGSTKISKGLQNGSDIIKLGRKDLQPHAEGSAVEDVMQNEDQEEESQERVGEEREHKKDFIDEESETEAQKEVANERKDTEGKEEERDEDKEEAKDGNKESEKESNDIGKEEVERKDDEREKSKEEESSSEENHATEIGDSQDNGSIETQEKRREEIVTTENGDSKEKGNEETQGKSSEENNSRENGEIKENKKKEGKSKEIEDKKLSDEKMIKSKATGSEDSGETNTDEKTKETREEKEGTVEDSVTPENQVPGGNDGEAAREENHEGEKNVSSEVDRESRNISETEGGITEKSKAGEQIENTEENQFEKKETKNTKATGLNQNNSGSNVTENAIMENHNSALNSLGNKNGNSLLETEDSSNQTTATTETGEQLKVNDNPMYYDGGKPASDPTSDTSLNQNKTVDNIIPFKDSMQTLLKEQTEKPEEMTAGENSDLHSALPATTEKKDLVNGDSIKSFNKIETVVLDEQSANSSTYNKTQNSDENSTWSHTNSEIPGTEEHHELSDGIANADSGQNKTGDFSNSSTVTEKEASSGANDNADASKHDEVNSDASSIPQDEKEARRDPDTLPKSGTEGNNHEVAAEK